MSKGMVDLEDFLWGFSIISLALYFLQRLRKAISMASLTLNSPLSPPFSPPLSWANQFFLEKGKRSSSSFVTRDAETKVAPNDHIGPSLQEGSGSPASRPERNIIREDERKGLLYGKLHCHDSYQKGLHEKYADDGNSDDHETLIAKGYSLDPLPAPKVEGDHNYKGFANKLKKRPERLVLPEYSPSFGFGEKNRKMENEEFEAQGRDFFLASKKGRREIMEDGYGVMVDILGDAKQAFFAVIDGHGGRAAADFVAENLGKNIVKALENVGKEDDDDGDELKQAIRGGYLVTDKEFLSQVSFLIQVIGKKWYIWVYIHIPKKRIDLVISNFEC
ncbi:hypothetical protein Tsubulata_049106 [Turnera subulata]|uniref:PPM-type phosphatase domain-containing protein n=1 Tax=Turnera subulata TaxID=218843 RepID=A0A9Q0FB08_9ROSI|nr:hypothetical protein Tsubulata_049106 [Turnera subulata]